MSANLITKENMERQISEMWDAVHNIPLNVPDRDEFINLANKTEADLRELYRKQEQLRDAAPDLLEALKALRRHGLIEKEGYETVVTMCGSAIIKAEL